jgi:hypothetical protein
MRKYLLSVVMAMVALLILASPAFAYIATPAIFDIVDVRVFRNLAETGDSLYVFEYRISDNAGVYNSTGNYSDTPAIDSWQFRLFDVDGTTLKATSTPYVYPYFESNGYGMGVSSFYFGASDNASAWGNAVIVNMLGSPSYYSPAISYSYPPLAASNYMTANITSDSQDALASYVLLLSDRLSSNYNIAGLELKASTDTAIVLSQYGENYFRGAISNLQVLCPQLFYVQVYTPEQMPTNYDMSMATTYGSRVGSEDLDEGFAALGSWMGGLPGPVSAGFVMLALTIGLCYWAIKKDWGMEAGLGMSAIVGLFFALVVGDLLFTVLMIGGLLAGMGIVYILIFKRA